MYHRHYQTRVTPQSEPIPGKAMAKNNAGGYAFPVDDWVRLDRFLVLDHGTVLAEDAPGAITRNAQVIEAYLGKKWGQHA